MLNSRGSSGGDCNDIQKITMSDIVLKLPEWKYKNLLKKIEDVKSGMRLFKINEQFKKSFMDDLFLIEGTIKQSKKGDKI